MNKQRLTHILFVFYLLIAFLKPLFVTGQISIGDAKVLSESVRLVTDRKVYFVDEDILFSVFNTSSEVLKKADWSQVIYIELITASGDPIVQDKFDFSEDGAHGQLRIPHGILTGNYYIRCYTRWMRNYNPSGYYYQLVTILNPYLNDILKPEAEVSKAGSDFKMLERNENIKLKTSKKVVAKNETVALTIQTSSSSDGPQKVSVSVVPKGSGLTQTYQPVSTPFSFTERFIPETRGLTISGLVKNKETDEPIPNSLVCLTILKQTPENLNIETNKNGQFFFDLSGQQGSYELFISAKPATGQEGAAEILIDNDFSSQKIRLPFVPVDFSKENKALFESMFETSQITSNYRLAKDSTQQLGRNLGEPFYGKADFVLKTDDYISLPTINDYFHELVPLGRVRTVDGQTTIKIVGNYPELETYDPLVMVDMVPVFDLDKVMAIDPAKIQRIEMVLVPYIRGSITYGGIVSFFSRENDLAGIDLPSAGRFFTYKMMEEKTDTKFQPLNGERIPSVGNCLYWNSSLHLEKGKSQISFSTGINSGEYEIVVTTADEKGELKVSTSEITIQ